MRRHTHFKVLKPGTVVRVIEGARTGQTGVIVPPDRPLSKHSLCVKFFDDSLNSTHRRKRWLWAYTSSQLEVLTDE